MALPQELIECTQLGAHVEGALSSWRGQRGLSLGVPPMAPRGRRPVSGLGWSIAWSFQRGVLIFGFSRLFRVETRQIDDIHGQHSLTGLQGLPGR